ncbi:23S rRNA (uracil(1939)-C(5))-methyltransferase RlmD [Thermotoga sp. KOL6]|uniref:23S rRNA (uracil(1939)-C(5))-methyltransferase RlmD n=1 Tax=Thermotoga sp. KOL6 TaxID=126741 RepID=UPI000C78FE9A|nr:23S rRNA (uracil(1939)-C(5))-methyltransferase RlmD [Thermotoga sp. KOL6]PLV59833.1 RNA methyltransferase [Thermotoga sp. KOL6]
MLERVKIDKMVNGGYGLAHLSNGKIVFVEGAYPGEEVLVKPVREKKDFSFGKVISFLRESKSRVKPACKYFGRCGGCHWMDMKYENQLIYKREILIDLFERSGIAVNVEEVEPSDLVYHYRTKMEFHFQGRKLGLKQRKSDTVIDIKSCEIAPEDTTEVLQTVREAVQVMNIPTYNWATRKGILKHLVVRYAFSTDQLMIIFVTKTESFPWGRSLVQAILRKVPKVYSIIHVMNSKDSVILRGPYRTLYGEGIIVEEFDWERFQIPPTAFFQSNYSVTSKLIDHVYKELALQGNETVLDLYAGIGTFSIRTSFSSSRVISVESSRIAVKAGKANANVNGRRNIEYVESDVLEFLRSYHGRADKVILDPPRSGTSLETVKEILRLSPERIVYVSCEPSTLVRDVKYFLEGGYSIERVKPFDMFPQTYHVETVVTLAKEEQ